MPPASSFAETLADHLLDRFPADRAYDRDALEDASAEDAGAKPALPHALRHFLERMMDRRVEIEREHLRVLHQPWVDHQHDDVQHAEEQLLAAVRRHVCIPRAAWERVLRHACDQVAAYLVRPVPALEQFIYGEGAPVTSSDEGGSVRQGTTEGDDMQDAVPAEVALRRMSYFSAYPYLRKAARAYVEQRGVDAFERTHLTTILRRVDEQMCHDHGPEDWLRLLDPLFAFGRAAYPDHDGLPASLLEAFFEEKDAGLPLRRLRTARREHAVAAFSSTTLKETIAPAEAAPPNTRPAEPARSQAPPPDGDARASSTADRQRRPQPPEPHQDADATTDEPAREAAPPPRQAPEADAPRAPDAASQQEEQSSPPAREAEPPAQEEEPEEAQPLWKRFQRGGKPQGASTSTEGASSRPSTPQTPDASARWQRLGSSGEQAPPADAAKPADGSQDAPASEALPSLEAAVLGADAGERERFVRELFGGSMAEYARVLQRLDEAGDWRSATQIIAQDVFRAHGVNIYSDAARSFTDAVETSFR